MTQRRNTCTAVLFLLGIFGAVIFLFVGALTYTCGFMEAARPSRSDHQVFAPSHKALRTASAIKKSGLLSLPRASMDKIDAFISLLDGYEILELARTGITGLSRGIKDVTYLE